MSATKSFDILAHVVEIANSSVDVAERLEGILGVVTTNMEARQGFLFMQEQREGKLVSSYVWPRQAGGGEPLSVEFGEGAVGHAAQARAPGIKKVELKGDDAVLAALGRQDEVACLLPVMDDNRLYAVFLLLFPAGRVLDDNDLRLLQMVVREMAGSVRNFKLYFEAKRRIAELNVLSDLGQAAISTIELDELLETVAGICAKLLGARGGLIKVITGNGAPMVLKAVHGTVPPKCTEDDLCGMIEDAAGPAEFTVGPCDCMEAPEHIGIRRGMCIPLTFKSTTTRGQLCVFDKMVHSGAGAPGFNEDDANLLSTMASMVSAALGNALTFQRVEDLAQRNEEMVGALATLNEISTVLMTTVDFNETLQIIMHAVTHPAGLDHDRVLLLLADEEGRNIRPVADMTKEEHGEHFSELTKALLAIKTQHTEPVTLNDPRLEDLEIALRPGVGVMARTLEKGVPQRVDDPDNDPSVGPNLYEIIGRYPFVSVPMFAKGKAVGVMVVNNFVSGRPITDRDLKLLAMLAGQGGLSVEASRLYQNLDNAYREMAQMRSRLLEADKLAALGEVAAGVAHEIRNPLVSIGGFTRRIRKKVGDDSSITPYLDVIIEEVTRLERTLNEMLDFSTDGRDHYDEYDLSAIMDGAVELLDRELLDNHIEVVRNYVDVPQVYCDERQIKHVFLNLVLNAIQAMSKEGGVINLRTFSVVREGKSFVGGEVSDTGGGIPMDVIHNIFNPFFTTKDSGSGLGLSIVHKIVTRHFGQVEVHPRAGEGASFLVTLPAAEEGRAYLK